MNEWFTQSHQIEINEFLPFAQSYEYRAEHQFNLTREAINSLSFLTLILSLSRQLCAHLCERAHAVFSLSSASNYYQIRNTQYARRVRATFTYKAKWLFFLCSFSQSQGCHIFDGSALNLQLRKQNRTERTLRAFAPSDKYFSKSAWIRMSCAHTHARTW